MFYLGSILTTIFIHVFNFLGSVSRDFLDIFGQEKESDMLEFL